MAIVKLGDVNAPVTTPAPVAKKSTPIEGVVVKTRLRDRLVKSFATAGRDIVIPKGKMLIYDFACQILRGALGIEGNINTTGSYISYDSIRGGTKSSRVVEPTDTSWLDSTRIQFTDRGAAELLFKELKEDASQWGKIRVNELYDKIHVSVAHTAVDFGWTYNELAQGMVVSLLNGKYCIKLPRAHAI